MGIVINGGAFLFKKEGEVWRYVYALHEKPRHPCNGCRFPRTICLLGSGSSEPVVLGAIHSPCVYDVILIHFSSLNEIWNFPTPRGTVSKLP